MGVCAWGNGEETDVWLLELWGRHDEFIACGLLRGVHDVCALSYRVCANVHVCAAHIAAAGHVFGII